MKSFLKLNKIFHNRIHSYTEVRYYEASVVSDNCFYFILFFCGDY